MKRERVIELWLAGFVLVAGLIVVVVLLGTAAADGPPMSERAPLSCNEQDGCYPHGDGCEERDYYCRDKETGCNYTSSNRHTDGWVDTGNMRWVDVNKCKKKEQKEQEYRDYECSGGSCNYSINDTKWLDTGNTSIKANGTICGCTANNTVKRCYDGNCTDTGIENASNCCADVACDEKKANCTCGDICVITTGWWRNGGAFHPTDTPIQAAIDSAGTDETICVKDGTYTENVDVDTQLTIRSENGAASTIVNASYSNDHVFEVTAGYVSISGFTVNGATDSWKAGIYLDSNIGHCNIYDNNASGNYVGIYMTGSSKYHTITGNTASNNDRYGIYLDYSSRNNTISGNTALNNYRGIYLYYSSSNTIADNTASNNDYGIRLFQSSNNLIYNNYFNNIRNNAQDDGSNIWNITPTLGENIIGGSWLGGNYWSDYNGIDANGDGLGDTLLPYNANGDILVGGDMHPLVPAGIAPLLSLEKTDDPDPVQAGGTLNYSISVSNKGYVNALAVTVTEIYDVNVTFESAIPAPSSGNNMWIFPALNANETKLINISVTVNPLTAMGSVLHNTVTVSSAEGVTDTDTEATTVFSEGLNCTCGDICVITTGWWRNGGAFHPTDTPIQAAIDSAGTDETICVKDGTYTENVDVDTQLTIRSENGAASTIVNASYSNDHVFEVTAGYVSISGFTVNGATDSWKAGIYLDSNIGHCNIYDNNASGNYVGIYMTGSSKYHTITGNTASNNDRYGIYLDYSSRNNTISGNTALNNYRGIYLYYSSSNTIADNTASNNDYGIRLFQSSNNLIYNNYFNNIRNNAQDDGSNIWNITPTLGENIIGGSWLGGNYWSDYNGIDANGDGLGDTLLPYNANGDILVGGDMHPLVPAGIAPLLSLEKTDDPDPVQAGGTLNYSISVSNKGYVNALAVTVTEIYDVNVTFESAIPAPSSGNNMWIFPALNANETKLINISVTVNPLTAMGSVLHNTVTVSSAEGVTDTDTEATTVFSEGLNCTCGDICVITTGWWRNGGAFHPTDTPIQAAIDSAGTDETICVKDGTYTENVDVDTQLTIRSENGAASTIVNASYSNDHVFEVTAGYVSISGFTVNGATDSWKAGIYLDSNIGHCNIYDNNASGNYVGIYMTGSSKYHTITGNTASNNDRYGIYLDYSSRNNTISGNTALNNYRGIYLYYSSSNTIADNTASNNDYGIRLFQSSNNLIYNNYFNNIRNNAQDDGSNIWNITPTLGENIIGGSWLGGNYWSDYNGIDANGDGLGDTLLPYNANGDILVGGDMHPLVPAGIAPLLSLEKTDDPDPVQAGGTLNYSISVSNKGYVNALAVTVTEIYDVNVTFESAIPAPSSGNNMWIFPALNANETKLINISVTVNPLTAMGSVLHNTVTVSSAEGVTDTDTEATTVFSEGLNCTCGDICVITTGWWRNGGAFHPTDTPIQAAIDSAGTDETICVKDGTYTENVDVDTQLTIRSENGAASTIVNASYSNDHVFEVTAGYVSISGFTVNGATDSWKAGIYLDSNIGHCNIYDNNASGNYVGIYMTGSSKYHTITGNTASNNDRYGIYLDYSSRNNTISGNTALNNYRGIYLYYSSSNTIADNTASNNDYGIRLFQSSNNLIYNNYFNNIRNNAQDDGSNIWNITPTLGENIIGGSWLGGNYWSDYNGIDANGDGLGDTLLPYNSNGDILVGGDMHPLVPAGIAPLLSVEKTDDPDPVQAGCTLNYSISVSNKGYIYASAVIVKEIYDVNVAYDSAIPAPSSGNDMWIFPALNANETKRINISVTVNPLTTMGTVLHNTVNVSCAEGVTDTDTEATTVFSEEPNCICGDICVNTTGWWRDGGTFNPSDTPIQDAIDNAIAGETICVKDGTYTENVDVDTQLTIRSENGASSTTVNALYSNDHVFEVTADYVSISGFTVNGAIGGGEAGIYLGSNIGHCNIYDNNASGNCYGIYLHSSSTNNQIYNNYFNNTNNAQDDGTNIWNITKTAGTNIIGGPYLGGNYWSDYTGGDTDGDGLGDTLIPYNSYGDITNGGDWHPLVESAISLPDLVILEKWVCWPDNCTICYNVTNIGDGTAPAGHNTTLYVDGVAVAHDHVPVDLAPGESYTGCFDGYVWTYTPPSDNITVCADNNEALDELDEDNNCLTNIWMCGDVRKDGFVTAWDVAVLNSYVAGIGELEVERKWAGDVRTDGYITAWDVAVLNSKVAGIGAISCMCTQPDL